METDEVLELDAQYTTGQVGFVYILISRYLIPIAFNTFYSNYLT